MIQSSIGQEITPEVACVTILGTMNETFCDNADLCLSKGTISCIGNQLGYPVPCPPATPFCVTSEAAKAGAKIGKCSATKSPTQLSTSNTACPPGVISSFTCTAQTFFPDPIDCQTYHECSLTNTPVLPPGNPPVFVMINTPKLRSCRPEYAYNPTTQVCDLRFYPGKCTQIICTAADLYKYKFYGTNKQYFALCLTDNNTRMMKPIMYSCPDNTIANIAQIPFKCEYVCKRVGFFTNSSDQTKFFECYMTNGKFMSEEGKCEDDKIFQEDRNVLKKNCIYK